MFLRHSTHRIVGALASRYRNDSLIQSVARFHAVRDFSSLPPLRSEKSDMAIAELEGGTTTTGTFKVNSTDLASVISPDANDKYPEVLATARMVAFMEIVCARMLVPHLPSGQLSVGVRVDATHLAATPVNEDVTVTAKFRGKEGKLFAFDVAASDAGGEIGKAFHTRAVVEEKRLMAGTKKRFGGA